MTQLLEAGQGELERKVKFDMGRSCRRSLINGNLYSGLIDVDLEHYQEVLDYLKAHQKEYGELHPAELEQPFPKDSILMEFKKKQALSFARAVYEARSTQRNPLRYVRDIDAYNGPPGFLT